MNELQYPEDLIIEITHKFADIEVERKEWLSLRLVNSMLNWSLIPHSWYFVTNQALPRTFQQAYTFHSLCARFQDC